MKSLLASISLLSIFTGCSNAGKPGNSHSTDSSVATVEPAAALLQYSIINTYPHDTAYFTEGLEFHNGQLYESSGGNLNESPYPSAIGIANLQTGKVDTKVILDRAKYFGEGITFFGNKLYQLTWTSGVGFLYHPDNFRKIGEFRIPAKQGWGLTHDSLHLYMSDGTSNIYVLQPDSLKVLRTLTVNDQTGPLSNINELEFANGVIYANQWLSPYILRIDPATGKVNGRLDLSAITNDIESKYPDSHELNGIAYNPASQSFIITGKKWPVMYEIRIR